MSGSRILLDVQKVGELAVAALRGKEVLSGPYRFDLEVVVAKSVDPAALLGAGARLRLDVGGHVRVVTGQLERVRRGDILASGMQRLKVRLTPRLRRLSARKRSRIFQGKTTRGLVGEVLREHEVPWRADLSLEHPIREVCVQHEETDLELVTRLLAEEGIAYRFEQPELDAGPDATEVLVMFDGAAAYAKLPHGERLVHRPQLPGGDGMLREERDVSSFVDETRRSSEQVHLRAFDFRRPIAMRTAGEAAEELGVASVVEHHGPYGEMQVGPQSPAVVLDQVRRNARRQEGTSACARLSPGLYFHLDEHEDPALQADFAVVEVRHTGRSEPTSDGANDSYDNQFGCVAKDFLLRPVRPVRRVRQALETALVTGPENEEIHTDDLGRIKVQFHWDLEGKNDAHSSCWVRVSQNWAGAGWGAQFIPRVGMEVLVAFLGGDPDRPLVVGCVPNATHPPAFPLPANKTRSGWKTRSTPDNPDAGHNEISFEDAAGGERVAVIAKRDFDVTVRNDMRTSISGDSVLEVAASHGVVVAGTHQLSVDGAASAVFRGGSTVSVDGELDETISGDRRLKVEQDVEETIEGSSRSRVSGEQKDTVEGPWTMEAESLFTLIVGRHDSAGHAEVQVRGSSVHTTDGSAVIESRESLTLICGDSRIELTPQAIVLSSPSLSLRAKSVAVEGDGPALRLTDRAELVADNMKLYGKQSSLELDKDATVKGSKIYLNCGPPPPPKEDEEGEPTMQKLRVKISDEHFEPYAAKPFEIRADAVKHEGTTGPNGEIEVDVPKTASVAHATIWTGSYPTGPKKTHTIKIAPLEPPDSLPGLRLRLKNLGYYDGGIEGEELDPATSGAVREFQLDHDLQPTGQVDDATRATVVERHGH